MHKRSSNRIVNFFKYTAAEFREFFSFFFSYIKKKLVAFSVWFEKNKNRLVKFFLMKRGRYNRPFLHIATMGVLGVGVLIAPFLADTYPIFTKASADLTVSAAKKQSIFADDNVFQTEISEKPRDKILTYTVERGDTMESIAHKFGISQDTIKWENDLTGNDLSIGDELKILPVTGIAHKVEEGESIYSIAKKYDSDAQKIVDFPFNEFAGNGETFGLVTGQIVIVPDGVKPDEQVAYKAIRQQEAEKYLGSVPVSGGGWVFPVSGEITQYPSWYHMALDIAGSIGSPVMAAHAGTVSYVSAGGYDTGYGTNIWIDDGDGIKTHYAHLNSANVSVGQSVGAGQVIGYRGNTGRSTGPHLHFEVQVNGALVSPLGYVHP